MTTEKQCPHCGKPVSPNTLMGLCPDCMLKAALGTGVTGETTLKQAGLFTPPSPSELSRYFPQLEILELLGRGGMGAVYKVRQKQIDRIVALKILPPTVSQDPSFASRFVREAKALAKLNHPHIVTLYEFGQADGLFYFLMEFVDGANLRQLLNASHLTPKEALAIVPQICDALQYAHDRGIVHRDIKPENILLGKDGQVKIADFGVAKIIAQESGETSAAPATGPAAAAAATDAGRVLGTPQYMAPEQMNQPLEVDHRADIYSLGVVFYQMLTGELPKERLEPPSKKVTIDVRLDEVVLRALEKDPALRYQQVSDVKTMVETITRTAGSTPAPAAAAPALSTKKMIPLVGLGICSICLAVGLILPAPGSYSPLIIGLLGTIHFLLRVIRQQAAIVAADASTGASPTSLKENLALKLRTRWKTAGGLIAAVAIVLAVRAFVLTPYYVTNDAASPGIPAGSYVLVYKLALSFSPGDIIAYDLNGKLRLGRVTQASVNRETVEVARSNGDSLSISLSDIVGRVILNTRAGQVVQQRSVNKRLREFPDTVDLSTPESALAAYHRASARMDAQAVLELGWRQHGPREREELKRFWARNPQDSAIYNQAQLEAEIIEVAVYCDDLASVISKLEFPKGVGDRPYSERCFGRINGVWKNLGEDRCESLESARANFLRKKEVIREQFLKISTAHTTYATSPNSISATKQSKLASADSSPADATQKAQDEVLQLKLRQAEEELRIREEAFKMGTLDSTHLQAAKDAVELLKAEIAGDPVQAARVRLESARRQSELIDVRYKAGLAPSSEYREANNAVELREAELRLAESAAAASGQSPAATITVKTMPPQVIQTVPQAGETEVDPALKEIRVTFSKEMMTDHMWSVCQISKETFPKTGPEIHYLDDNRTCVIPVSLEPEKHYVLWFNRGQFDAFRDTGNNPAVPYLLVFRTGKSK